MMPGKNGLCRIRFECQSNRLFFQERRGEPLRNNKEAAGLARVDTFVPFVERHLFNRDQLTELPLAVSSCDQAAEQRIILVMNQKHAGRAGTVATINHRRDQAADQKRNAKPQQHRHWVLSPARQVFQERCKQETHDLLAKLLACQQQEQGLEVRTPQAGLGDGTAHRRDGGKNFGEML